MLSANARVVKWQTRTFEGRMPQGMGVQVPPRAFLFQVSPNTGSIGIWAPTALFSTCLPPATVYCAIKPPANLVPHWPAAQES